MRRSTCAFLDRLALGTHLADHGAHLPYADAVGNLNLDLFVVRHLRYLADEAAVGHDDIPAAQAFHHLLMLLHALLLRTQDQEIHDHDDQNKRREIDEHIVGAAGTTQAELRVNRADDQHCSSGDPSQTHGPHLKARFPAEIGADYSHRRPNCNAASLPPPGSTGRAPKRACEGFGAPLREMARAGYEHGPISSTFPRQSHARSRERCNWPAALAR